MARKGRPGLKELDDEDFNFLNEDEVIKRIRSRYNSLDDAAKCTSDDEQLIEEYTKKGPKKSHKKEEKFSMTPKEIKSYLDEYIISQEQAKRDVAVAVSYHYNRLANANIERKNNILLIGPTGVGKTYILQKIASIIKVPFVEVDISKFSKTGYVGMSVDDILRYVLSKANNKKEEAEKAIVYIDEIDKIRTQFTSGGGRDINGQDIQTELLKILEGAEIPITVGGPMSRENLISVDTRNMLFVCSGAFPDLEQIIGARIGKEKSIGFSATPTKRSETDSNFDKVSVEDLVKYGFLREFLGRLPVITVLSPLSKPDLKRILSEPKNSLLEQYKNELKPFGIDIEFTDEALDMIAEMAYSHKIGARALNTVCESILKHYKYELPGRGVTKLVITKEAITEPDAEIARLLGKK